MEDYKLAIRHLGAPVKIELGDDILTFPRFNMEEFADAILIAKQIEDKVVPEAEGTPVMLRILVRVVQRKFKKDIEDGRISVETCESLILDNAEQFMLQMEEFMPRMSSERTTQRLENLLKKKQEHAKSNPQPGPKPTTNA